MASPTFTERTGTGNRLAPAEQGKQSAAVPGTAGKPAEQGKQSAAENRGATDAQVSSKASPA